MEPDGTNQIRITNNPAEDAQPVSSPDGDKIAFTSDRDGIDIYLMNPDGSGQTRLTDTLALENYPSWFPGIVP